MDADSRTISMDTKIKDIPGNLVNVLKKRESLPFALSLSFLPLPPPTSAPSTPPVHPRVIFPIDFHAARTPARPLTFAGQGARRTKFINFDSTITGGGYYYFFP
jgi:hypothetical protein